MTTFIDTLKSKLYQELDAEQVEIVDESWKHAGHAGNSGRFPDGTHLEVSIVSKRFEGLGLMERHRLVHKLLKQEMAERIHALTLKTDTP